MLQFLKTDVGCCLMPFSTQECGGKCMHLAPSRGSGCICHQHLSRRVCPVTPSGPAREGPGELPVTMAGCSLPLSPLHPLLYLLTQEGGGGFPTAPICVALFLIRRRGRTQSVSEV